MLLSNEKITQVIKDITIFLNPSIIRSKPKLPWFLSKYADSYS